jgi:pilus assembly protein Flp/PilA
MTLIVPRHSRGVGPGASSGGGLVKLSIEGLRRLRGQAGQGLAEYALILALVAVAAIAAITFMGGSINTMLSDLGNAI